MTENDSIRSSSPTVFDDANYHQQSSFFSCCQCSRRSRNPSTKIDRQEGFFQRIQIFKAQKRQSSVRKQQLALTSTMSNGYLPVENPSIEYHSYVPPPSPYQHYHRSSIEYVTSPIRNSQSIPSLHHYSYRHRLNEHFDAYSFNDIEMGSSSTTTNEKNETRRTFRRSTSKSILSQNLSSATTDLSTYSTQSLLRKLLDKAQVLDYYYNEIWKKTNHHSSLSLTSSSSNSMIGRSTSLSRTIDSKNKSPSRHLRGYYGNISSDSSRYDLYNDEDNVLRELIRFNNDIDLILSRLEMEGETLSQPTNNNDSSSLPIPPVVVSSSTSDDNPLQSTINPKGKDEQEDIDSSIPNEILSMRTNLNEINIHLLLSMDINRLREGALAKLLKMTRDNCDADQQHDYETISLSKLNKLPKSTTWKGKHVFGVPLRIYQQTTGQVLPLAISQALQYVRLHAGKCEGLFRKPGVKSKIDRLRAQIESTQANCTDPSTEMIKFEEYQPFVVADVIRQYFRELPEGLISPVLTRLLCELMKYITQEEQILAIRYTFLLLPDENREVLENLLRFLLDVSIRSGSSQTVCRSLARIFLPSVFQSYYDIHPTSTKFLWWKRKKEKSDAIQQENERLNLEHCLMMMILNVDLLCRVPSELNDELQLSSVKKTKRLDDLIRNACHGEFHMKKYMSKDSEQFLQRLGTMKFKNVPTQIDGVHLSIHKSIGNTPNDTENNNLPIWKCSIDIPNSNVKSVCQRIIHERYLWDQHFAESRVVEKIDDDKEIVQYVLNFLDSVPVRSFCEFRFLKKVTSHTIPNGHAMLISSISIDHLQNHFLPGSIALTNHMHYYITPSTTHPDWTTVTQMASVDYSGRSTYWYEHVYGSLLAFNLTKLRDTFIRNKVIRV